MATLRFNAPLSWPEGIPQMPRTQQRKDHGFSPQLSLVESISFLEEEAASLDLSNATLSMDIEQPLVERLRKKVGSRTGACLHFKHLTKGYVLACDTWQTLEHNIYALHLALRQLRNIERWGVGTLPMLFSGFEANKTPEAIESRQMLPWMEFLGLGPTATLEDAVAIYHRRARSIGHDTEALTQLNIIMDEAREFFAAQP